MYGLEFEYLTPDFFISNIAQIESQFIKNQDNED